jgi:predicted nucleic acid-binding protein
MLIDTDVIVWMTRGHVGATSLLQSLLPWRISAVTYIELAQGCRNKSELVQIKKGLALCQAEIMPIDETITNQAIALIEQYVLSHGLQLADALIAATAMNSKVTLLTANAKHFSMIDGLQIETFHP